MLEIKIVQCFSSSIGQTVNLAIWQGRKALKRIGIATDYFDGTIGVFVSASISIIISVFIIVYIYDKLVLKRLKKVLDFTKKLGNGDLSEELKFRGHDDISILEESLNKAAMNIRFLVSDIINISKNINISSCELLEETKKSYSSINIINSTSSILSNDASNFNEYQ